MNNSVLFLYLWNLCLIGGLPFFFFKKGRKNIRWWITAAPFFICALYLFLAYFEYLQPLNKSSTWQPIADIVATALSISSISLIFYTLGSHRVPLNLWHQDNDKPDHIVTYGAYSKIRHPFYSAFILVLLGTLVFCPHVVTIFIFIYGVLILNMTAAKEEKKLLKYDESYKAYIKKTGRFFPKFKAGL